MNVFFFLYEKKKMQGREGYLGASEKTGDSLVETAFTHDRVLVVKS